MTTLPTALVVILIALAVAFLVNEVTRKVAAPARAGRRHPQPPAATAWRMPAAGHPGPANPYWPPTPAQIPKPPVSDSAPYVPVPPEIKARAMRYEQTRDPGEYQDLRHDPRLLFTFWYAVWEERDQSDARERRPLSHRALS